MKENTPVSEQELHAYVDGELDERRRLAVEKWLATHPEDMTTVQQYRRINEQLHAVFDKALTIPVEEPIASSQWYWGNFARTATIIVLIGLSGVLGWSLKPNQNNQIPSIVQDLVQPAAFAHAVFSFDSHHPVEISAKNKVSLNEWVSTRIDSDLQVPQLSSVGLKLLGGRLLPSTNRMAAQYMYQDKDGERVTVYVRRFNGKGSPGFEYREQDGFNVFFWTENNMGYAVIGTQPAAQVISVAKAVKAEFDKQTF